MSHSHDSFSPNPSKYTATAIFSFVCIFALLMLFMRCHGDYAPNAIHHTTTHKATTNVAEHNATTTHEAVATQESIKVKLPNGKELDAYKGGIEDKLVTFLNDSTKVGSKDAWFDFDNLNFENGKATITKESEAQVANIAAILAAYPKMKIKIGGYTDKSGDAAFNKKLSGDRANAVLSSLQNLKANGAQLLGAEGYGAEFAKAAANAPEEERKKDRHISICVREK